jgi:predicted ATPase/class 3 adenylate cyclase
MHMEVPSGLVTLLFTDIEGSTKAWEAHPAEMQAALARHDDLLRGEIESAGGYVFKTVGDAFCAAFHEASAGLATAVTIQRALATEVWPAKTPIRVRMALHSGTCEERGGDYFGPVVNRAARLEAVAHGGQLVLSRLTAELVGERLAAEVTLRDLGEHRLKDLGRAERVYQVCAAGLESEFAPLRSLENPALQHNLPEQVSSFVGRDREVAEVHALLDSARLVTLAGPGGVGKTRLALQAAVEVLDGSGDGVWFVDLAPIAEPSLVAASVASVMWIREEQDRPLVESLVDALRDRRVLLVLDNCEQVITAVALLTEALLRHCPRIVLLATSREPLGIGGEHVYRVPSLPVPELDDDLATMAGREAVRLFVERAGQQKPGFAIDGDNAATVGRLCRRLDGIPFAIELAAARLRSMSVWDLESHLDRRFRLLTGGSRTALPRQQTLEALIDWSYDLLSAPEQAVLARLSVFAGGFGMDAAAAVGAGGDVEDFEVDELLDALVDKSLVQADESGHTQRYRLLETMRDYAAVRLAKRADEDLARATRAHRDWFLRLAEDAEPHLRGPGEVEWTERLDGELDNLRVALATCLSDPDPAFGLRLADALAEFWFIRGHGVEGVERLRAQLDRPAAQAPTLRRGRALAAAGYLVAYYVGDYPGAVAMAEEAVTIAHTVADDALAARALHVLVMVRYLEGDYHRCLSLVADALPIARRLEDPRAAARLLNRQGSALYELGGDGRAAYDEATTLFRQAGDRIGVATAIGNSGLAALDSGDLDAARILFDTAAGVFHELGDRRGEAVFLCDAGHVAYLGGDGITAGRLFRDSLEIARRCGARMEIAYPVLGLALTATLTGNAARGALLHGIFDALFEQLGAAVEALEARLREADHRRAQAQLGEAAFEEAYRRGREMPFDEAIAFTILVD